VPYKYLYRGIDRRSRPWSPRGHPSRRRLERRRFLRVGGYVLDLMRQFPPTVSELQGLGVFAPREDFPSPRVERIIISPHPDLLPEGEGTLTQPGMLLVVAIGRAERSLLLRPSKGVVAVYRRSPSGGMKVGGDSAGTLPQVGDRNGWFTARPESRSTPPGAPHISGRDARLPAGAVSNG
jgi:hypothetical protein